MGYYHKRSLVGGRYVVEVMAVSQVAYVRADGQLDGANVNKRIRDVI